MAGTIIEILGIALEVGKFVAEAIASGNDKVWRPIADLMPSPLKSRIEMSAQAVKTRKDLENVLD